MICLNNAVDIIASTDCILPVHATTACTYCIFTHIHVTYVIPQLLSVVCNSDFRIFRIDFLYAVPYHFVKLLKKEGWAILAVTKGGKLPTPNWV